MFVFTLLNNNITNYNTSHSLICKIKELNHQMDFDYKIKICGNILELSVFEEDIKNLMLNNIKKIEEDSLSLSYQNDKNIISSKIFLLNFHDETEEYNETLLKLKDMYMNKEPLYLSGVFSHGVKFLKLFINNCISFGKENDDLIKKLLKKLEIQKKQKFKKIKENKYSFYRSYSLNENTGEMRGMYRFFRNELNIKIEDKLFVIKEIIDLSSNEKLSVEDYLNKHFKQYFLKKGCEIIANHSLPNNEELVIFTKNKTSNKDINNSDLKIYNSIKLEVKVNVTDVNLFEKNFLRNHLGKYQSYSIGNIDVQ